MNSQNNINDELRGLNSDLPSNGDKHPYSVPEGYFDGFASSLLAKIKGEKEFSAPEEIARLSPLLAGIARTMPYDIPSSYFEKAIEELPVLVRDDENSLILSLIDKTMPYAVPLGYFANFPEQVLTRLSGKGAKVISLRSRWMRVAAAAVVTGIMAISGYLYFAQKTTYQSSQPIAQELKNVSTKELEEFIKTADITATSTETATSGGKEVRKMLRDVPDKELDAFLKEVPTDDEDLFAIN